MNEHISTSAIEPIELSSYLDYLDIEDRDDRDLAYEEIAEIQQSELADDRDSWTSGDDVIW